MLSLLLVLVFAPRGFSPGTPVFPSPQKPTPPNSNSIWKVSPIIIIAKDIDTITSLFGRPVLEPLSLYDVEIRSYYLLSIDMLSFYMIEEIKGLR